MTCAQGLLRLLWGGPEVGVLRDWAEAFLKPKGIVLYSNNSRGLMIAVFFGAAGAKGI